MNNLAEGARAWLRLVVMIFCLWVYSISLVACGHREERFRMDRGDGLGAEAFEVAPHNPGCPTEAINRKVDGLVVVAIEVSDKGKLETAKVLVSPSKSLGDAALRNTRSTSFRMPGTEAEPSKPGAGRLFFYFHCSSFPFKALMPSDLVEKH